MLISKVQAVYSLKLILQFVRRHALLNVRSFTFESASFLLPDWYYSCKNSTAKFHHRLSTWIMVCFFFWFKKYFGVCVFCVNACFFLYLFTVPSSEIHFLQGRVFSFCVFSILCRHLHKFELLWSLAQNCHILQEKVCSFCAFCVNSCMLGTFCGP